MMKKMKTKKTIITQEFYNNVLLPHCQIKYDDFIRFMHEEGYDVASWKKLPIKQQVSKMLFFWKKNGSPKNTPMPLMSNIVKASPEWLRLHGMEFSKWLLDNHHVEVDYSGIKNFPKREELGELLIKFSKERYPNCINITSMPIG